MNMTSAHVEFHQNRHIHLGFRIFKPPKIAFIDQTNGHISACRLYVYLYSVSIRGPTD